jgi:hypothetical protein
MTITLITLLKRRAGLSKADFIDYYESHHRLIGQKVLSGYATRYTRRYLHPTDGEEQHEDADVVMEIDFPDEATKDACFAAMSDEATIKEIVADEERLFDRNRIRTFTVEQRESAMPPIPPA